MASCDANIGASLAGPGDEQPISKAVMQRLVESLRSFLEIAGGTSSSSSGPNIDLLGYFQGHVAAGNRFRAAIEDLWSLMHKAQWNDFLNFMELRAKERPYPTYLYRAHTHGHMFPRFEDDGTEEYADSFGSDQHLWMENDAGTAIYMPTCEPTEVFTVDGVFEELSQHLNKTETNLQRQRSGEEPVLSNLVSLSGDFRWTTQRICKTGRLAREGHQLPGLAIFQTSVVKPGGVHLWRVRDMLEFLDSNPKTSVILAPNLRRWSANADEYACWGLVPKEALVSFIPLPELTQQFGNGDEGFLRKEFVNSTYLSDFRRHPLEPLSLEEYAGRVSSFMGQVIRHVSPWTKVGELDVGTLRGLFLNPDHWGYDVTAFWEDLDEKVTSSIEAALENGRTGECAADYPYEVGNVALG